MATACMREDLLLRAANQPNFEITEENLPALPHGNFDIKKLVLQLRMLHGLFTESDCFHTIAEVAAFFAKLDPSTVSLFNEVAKLIRLALSLPVSVAGSERSFSKLRMLKTWLRSSMSQSRLTHLAIMNVHREYLDLVDIQDLVKLFCMRTPERRKIFGY